MNDYELLEQAVLELVHGSERLPQRVKGIVEIINKIDCESMCLADKNNFEMIKLQVNTGDFTDISCCQVANVLFGIFVHSCKRSMLSDK